MIASCLYIANVVVLSRLQMLTQDRRLPTWQIVLACAIQEISLLAFAPRLALLAFGVLLLLTSVLWWFIERREGPSLLVKRLLLLVVYFILIGVFFSPSIGLSFRSNLKIDLVKLAEYFIPLSALIRVNWVHFSSHALGVLLCLNEANLAVRCLITALELRPQDVVGTSESNVSPQVEYNRGRIIGLLERITLFVLISLNQFGAIGFVVAGKALARFQSLDNRDFAEYFLIGTFASLVTAGTIALFIQRMLV
jgi:hypothetical protein